MAQLPTPGGDAGEWGNILNSFLLVAHNSDGTLQSSAISTAGGYLLPANGIPASTLDSSTQSILDSVADMYTKPASGIPSTDLSSSVQTMLGLANSSVQLGGDIGGTTADPVIAKLQGTTVNAASPASNQVLSYNSTANEWIPSAVSSTIVSDATSSNPGLVQLDGDLGNTATNPQVVATHLSSALPINQGGTGSVIQNFVTLGGDLGNTVIAPKVESIQGVSISGTPAVSQVLTATSATTAQWSTPAAGAGDATSSTPGLVQLDGDLGGSATSPTVAKLNGITIPTSAPTSSGQVLTTISTSATAWQTPASEAVSSVNGMTGAVMGLLQSSNNLSDISNSTTARNNIGAAQNLTPVSVVSTTASPYSAPAGSFVPVDVSGGSVTVILPTAPVDGTRLEVKMIHTANSNTIIINTGGGDVFNKAGGSTSLTLSVLNQGVMLQYMTSSAIWYVQSDDLPLTELAAQFLAANGVILSGSPTAGNVLVASSSTAASWGQIDGVTDWLNVKTYGATGDGTTDDTAAIMNAINALPSNGGVIYFPAGTYLVSSTITVDIAGVILRGDGRWCTIISYTGSGDCIRMYSSIGYGEGLFASGGGIEGLIIDGTNASAGACGAHIGDIYQLKFDFGVRFFKGTGSKGIWFDNQYYWCEDMYGHLFVEQNTSNLIFDNSANLTGQSSGSFARTYLTIVLDAKGVGDGVTIQNGAQVYAGEFNLQGNIDYSTTGTKYWVLTIAAPPIYSFTATDASPCVFTASGMYYGNGTSVFLQGASLPGGFTVGQSYSVVNTNTTDGTFQLSLTAGGSAINSTSSGSGTVQSFQASTLRHSVVNINVECNADQSGIQPGTINFTSSEAATGYNQIIGCTGIIDFTANNPLATANNSYNNFFFEGPVYGDSLLWRSIGTGSSFYYNGSLANNGLIYTQGVDVSVVDTTSNITGITMQGGIPSDSQKLTVLNSGTGSITFAAEGTSKVANGPGCIIEPNSSMMLQWNPGAYRWYPMIGTTGSSTPSPDMTLYLAPSGATAETFPRSQAAAYTSALTSGQSYVSAIAINANVTVSNLAIMVGNTGFSGVSHGWLALLDDNLNVLAVTADQTSGFGSTYSALKLAVDTPYATTYTGLYYVMVCVVASTLGNISIGNVPLTGPNATPPILAGSSSASQTTPPSTGTTMSAISASGSWRFYAYTA